MLYNVEIWILQDNSSSAIKSAKYDMAVPKIASSVCAQVHSFPEKCGLNVLSCFYKKKRSIFKIVISKLGQLCLSLSFYRLGILFVKNNVIKLLKFYVFHGFVT